MSMPRDNEMPEELEREMREKFLTLGRMTDEYLRKMPPQEKGRMLQTFYAQARGPVADGDLLRSMTDSIFRMRKRARESEEET